MDFFCPAKSVHIKAESRPYSDSGAKWKLPPEYYDWRTSRAA
jgi:hypothetical protein